jgi:tRNA threonylcarbamoyladenosine biosynthesis protein TsaB
MLLLAADTSGSQGSLALARGTRAQVDVLDLVPLTGGAFSAQLVPEIAGMLERARASKRELDAFAVVSGPGSFTGLRVGLAAIKGLAEILQKPIAAISLLEAVALAARTPGRVAAALDAGRSEAYAAIYQVEQERGTLCETLLATRENFLDLLQRKNPVCVATPDESILQWTAGSAVAARRLQRPRADEIARIGIRRIEAGEVTPPEQLDANYIRRSDAEIFSRPL